MKPKASYDDGNIPEIDLPKSKVTSGYSAENAADGTKKPKPTDPLPESARPRKDGPGGE